MAITTGMYNKAFTEAYEKLNSEQQKAVDRIEGPVMVIAGPGTGKTQILSARIGKILMVTDARPDNILCLTYTDAGVIAMRKRLLSFIGPDAYKVNIYTFHAFCNDVIQENLSLFEKTSLDPVSDLEKIELFKILIDSFPKNHPLKRYRGDVYYEISPLQSLFSAMKKEGWTPEHINQKIDAYLNDLPNRDEYRCKRATGRFKKGDLRTDKLEEEQDKMEKLRAGVNEFDNFQALMRQKNRYDFDDMINWVLRAFEENKPLLASYQERYLYILVDEYQDTSGTQNRLVQLLISYWESPNVFVVGDDDQSIYRFQGANVENMLDFAGMYLKDLLTVVLTSNYRSIQPILDVAKTLIDNNAERLVNKMEGLSKALVSSNKMISHLTHQPVLKEYETQRHEMADITDAIDQLVKQGTPPGKIAVIYRENRYGEALIQYLRVKNIPVYSKRSINVLQVPLARKIIQIIRYLAAEHDTPYGGDAMLFEILHYDFYNIPPIEIAKMMVEVNSKKYKGGLTSIRKVLQEKIATPAKTIFDIPVHQKLQDVGSSMESLIADAANLTIQTLAGAIVQKAGVLHYIMQQKEKIALLQVLTALLDFIREETRRNPGLSLHQLTLTIGLMADNDIPIPLVDISGTDKGVNLLTVHGSKGLEYDCIFFAGCNATSWEKKKKPGGGYKFPDTMFSSQPASTDEEELRRLFYVALTRARQHLYISYARFRPDGRELEPSMFIAEILNRHHLPVQRVTISTEAVMEYTILQYTACAPEIEKPEDDFIAGILDKFVMSVTALNNYLQCPLEFYFKNIIRLPVGKSEALEFGSAVHFAIQRLFEKMKADTREAFPPVQEMLGDFTWYMRRHRENFTPEAFSRRLEYGEEVLANYYATYLYTWPKTVAIERNISNIVVNGIPLRGKMDKLEFSGKEVNVVDYKSGDVENALEKLKPPNDRQPNGGDYWRQAVFYKILIDHYPEKDWKVVSTEFDFIEPDKKKEYIKKKIVIQPQDIETVTHQITDVWNKIQAHDFYTGCGKEHCHWCNFVKDNKLAVALHELQEQEVTGEY